MSHEQPTIRVFINVFVALLILLVLTVEVARHDFGELNFVAAVAIAATKASLIVLYFMHVRYSVKLTKLFACVGFYWLGIMFLFALADYWTR